MLSSSRVAARRVAAVVPSAPLRRAMSSAPAIVEAEPSAKAVATPVQPPKPTPVEPAYVKPERAASSSAWQRFVAFLTGMGVSSVWFYYTISQDVWESSAALDTSITALKSDLASTNQELRLRIAELEHKVESLK